MAIIGVASVKIKPDLSEFRRELKAGLDKIKAEFTVRVKADTDPARRTIEAFVARQELKDINKKVDIDRSSLGRAETALGSISKTVTGLARGLVSASLNVVSLGIKASAAAAAFVGLITVVGGVGHALAALAPAGLATGLGALLTLGTVIGTIKLGMAGIGRAMDALNGPIDRLRTAVQASFQSAFVPAVKNLQTIIPQLKTPLQEVATAVGGAATKFTLMLKTSENMALVRSIIENSAKAVKGLGQALAPLGHAFLEVGSVASKIFTSMTDGAGKFATEFADKISAKAASGQLEASFRNSIEAVHTLFNVIRDFGSGVANVFKSLTGSISGGSGSFLDTLGQIAAKFRSFTELESTKKLFATIGDVVHILSGAFFALLDAVGPVLPVLADTAKIISENLAGVIKDLAPLIADVAKHFLEIVQKVAPKLMPIIEKVAGAFLKILDAVLPLIDPLVGLLDALTPLIDPIVRLVQDLVPPLKELLKDLAPVVEILAKALGKLLDVIGPVVGGMIALADVNFGALLDGIGIGDGSTTASNGWAEIAGKAAGDAYAKGLKKGFQTVNTTAGKAVTDLFAALGIRNTEAESIGAALGGATGKGLGTGLSAAARQAAQIVDNILVGLGLRKPSFQEQGDTLARAFGDGMSSQRQALFDKALALVNGILDIFRGKQPTAADAGNSITRSLGGGVSSGAPWVNTAAQAVANGLVSVFGPVSLFGTGLRIGNSLADGLRGAISAVKTVLNAITTGIPLWKGPPNVDRVLLTPTGVMIMQGLINGIVSQQSALQAVLGDVTDQFSGASGSLSGSLSSSMLVSGELDRPIVQVNVGVNEGPLKDFVDVQIDEGNRQTRRKALAGGGLL